MIPDLIAAIVKNCISRHGGFAHGNYVAFCPACAEAIRELWDSKKLREAL